MRFREGLGIQTGDPFAERGPLPTADTIFNIQGPLPVADTIFKVQGSLPMAEQHLRDNKNSGISKAEAVGCGNGGSGQKGLGTHLMTGSCHRAFSLY